MFLILLFLARRNVKINHQKRGGHSSSVLRNVTNQQRLKLFLYYYYIYRKQASSYWLVYWYTESKAQILIHYTFKMPLFVHLMLMSLVFTSTVSQSRQICLWWQRPCTTTTNRPIIVRYCDTWCEHPIGSGRFKCCDQVPDPKTTERPKRKLLLVMRFHVCYLFVLL